jgi:DNA end-binding protein Ku
MPSAHKRHHSAEGEGHTGPRPAWSGTLSFGLVSIPVALHPATHAAGPRAHMFAEDGSALHRHYYCPRDDRDLESSELVRGFELPDKPDHYVEVLDEELAALAPKKSREIALHAFCERAALHESLFERAYVLSPTEVGAKAYKLLAEAMQRADRAGIATFVLRERAYIVAILAQGGLLLAETLRFADELRSPADVGLPKREAPSKALVSRMSRVLLEKQRGRFDPQKLVDPAHKKLEQLLAAKKKRGEVVSAPEAEPETGEQASAEVVDLMALLKDSLQQSKSPPARKRARG